MIRERVAENVYVFTSELYAHVNAGAVIGPEWSVLIDTLPLPNDTLEIREFLNNKLGCPVRYVINTHYHADHTNGTFLFPSATVISSERCRQLLATLGREALAAAKQENRDLQEVEIVIPNIVFDKGTLSIRVGKRILRMLPLPGHTEDGIGVLIEDNKVLFAGDIMMPLPYIGDGDYEVMVETLRAIPDLKLENLVQGHGEVILRGEIAQKVQSNLNYLQKIRREVRKAARRRNWMAYLSSVDIEACGKSRILLNGMVEELHHRNLISLFHQLYGERP